MARRVRGSFLLLLVAFVLVPSGRRAPLSRRGAVPRSRTRRWRWRASRTSRRRDRLHAARHRGAQRRADAGAGHRQVGAGPRPLRRGHQPAPTRDERDGFRNWLDVRELALKNPRHAQRMLDRFGDNVKVPIFVQGGIHGNEYEGVDAAVDVIERYATTPAGVDPAVDRVLRQRDPGLQPDPEPGRARRGHPPERQRLRSQPRLSDAVAIRDPASIELMKRWLPPELLTCTATSRRR